MKVYSFKGFLMEYSVQASPCAGFEQVSLTTSQRPPGLSAGFPALIINRRSTEHADIFPLFCCEAFQLWSYLLKTSTAQAHIDWLH